MDIGQLCIYLPWRLYFGRNVLGLNWLCYHVRKGCLVRNRDLQKAGKLTLVSLSMKSAKEGSWGWHLQALGKQSLLPALSPTQHGKGGPVQRKGMC